jgi:hypothetical protein
VGLFLLVRMGLVHMWALYKRPNGLNKIRKQHVAHYIHHGRQESFKRLMNCFFLFND